MRYWLAGRLARSLSLGKNCPSHTIELSFGSTSSPSSSMWTRWDKVVQEPQLLSIFRFLQLLSLAGSLVPRLLPSLAGSLVPRLLPSLAGSLVPRLLPSLAGSLIPRLLPSLAGSLVHRLLDRLQYANMKGKAVLGI